MDILKIVLFGGGGYQGSNITFWNPDSKMMMMMIDGWMDETRIPLFILISNFVCQYIFFLYFFLIYFVVLCTS